MGIQAGGQLYPTQGSQTTNMEAYEQYCNACLYGDIFHEDGARPMMSFRQWMKQPIYCVNLRKDGTTFWHSKTDTSIRGNVSMEYTRPIDGANPAITCDIIFACFSWASFEIDGEGSVRTHEGY